MALGLQELLFYLRDKYGEKCVERIREYPSGDIEAYGLLPDTEIKDWWLGGTRQEIVKELLNAEVQAEQDAGPTTGINWRDRADTKDFPEDGERILVFSPEYPKGHEMQVRIMDARFFRISIEATKWAPINIPGVK